MSLCERTLNKTKEETSFLRLHTPIDRAITNSPWVERFTFLGWQASLHLLLASPLRLNSNSRTFNYRLFRKIQSNCFRAGSIYCSRIILIRLCAGTNKKPSSSFSSPPSSFIFIVFHMYLLLLFCNFMQLINSDYFTDCEKRVYSVHFILIVHIRNSIVRILSTYL